MTTKKQIEANKKNALLSTGAITDQGKEIVCVNAIKHGIFAKDLIISSGLAKENEGEYFEIMTNLIACLSPQNQIESFLVEKIAVDIWRLKRVIRFETGSIRQCLQEIFEKYYSYDKKENKEIEQQIECKKSTVEWNVAYLENLQKGIVTFDQLVWEGEGIKTDIIEDLYMIARSLDSEKFTHEEKEKMRFGELTFLELKTLLKRNGYSSLDEITEKLIELYSLQNQRLEEEILELEQKITANAAADELNTKLCAIPKDENVDKVLKYERSIQKSIFQNLFLLKKLQGSF